MSVRRTAVHRCREAGTGQEEEEEEEEEDVVGFDGEDQDNLEAFDVTSWRMRRFAPGAQRKARRSPPPTVRAMP